MKPVRISAQTNQPTLRIIITNQAPKIFWPADATNFLLQSAADLTANSLWQNLAASSLFTVLNTFPAAGGSAQWTTNFAGSEDFFMPPATNAQNFFRLRTPPPIPLCCFDIFYNGVLEFTLVPTMTRNGRIHANGTIYVGTPGSLTFNQTVTTTFTFSSQGLDGQANYGTNTRTYFLGSPDAITNCPPLVLNIGTNDPHMLIDIPPAAENPLSSLGQQRLFNQAQIVLLVTNDATGLNTHPTVTLWLRAGAFPGGDASPIVISVTNADAGSLADNFPFLTLTNNFLDRREMKTNIVTDFDVGAYADWVVTNPLVQMKLPASSSIFPTLLFIADQRTKTSYQVGRFPVVRVRNAAQLPFNGGAGFTLATPNPLYVLGNYNIQVPGNTNQSLSTNDTTYTVPAALVSDALTILGATWSDATSYNLYYSGLSSFTTTDTTVNAAILAGTMPSTGSSDTTFSGGLQNLPRLLQNWSAKNLWLNSSIVRLWNSQMANNQFRNPDGFSPAPVNPYYNAPIRHFNFDANFLNPAKIPPGMPLVYVTTNSLPH